MCSWNRTAGSDSNEPTKNNTPRDVDDKKKLKRILILIMIILLLLTTSIRRKKIKITSYSRRLTSVLSTGFVRELDF